jgi:predicted amidophosphoribosyltransferase
MSEAALRTEAELATRRLLKFVGHDSEEPDPRPFHHYRHAGLGTWVCHRTLPEETMAALLAWKKDPAKRETFIRQAAEDLAGLIRVWQPAIPAEWVVTVPPAGASAPGPYPAGFLARKVAELLSRPFITTLARKDQKRYHGRHYTLNQKAFKVKTKPLSVALVVDDIATSGTTMRLSLEALRSAGVPAFGFAFWGND